MPFVFSLPFSETSGFADKFSLLDEPVAFYAIIVFLPDVLIFAAPATHKVPAKKSVTAAGIAGRVVATAQVKQSCQMAMNTFDLTETFA